MSSNGGKDSRTGRSFSFFVGDCGRRRQSNNCSIQGGDFNRFLELILASKVYNMYKIFVGEKGPRGTYGHHGAKNC